MFSALCLALPLSLAALVAASPMQLAIRNSQPFYVPFYDATANGHTSPARGWNSFGIQANSGTQKTAGWDFNDYHFAQQCDLMVTQPGYDYVCSIDSGWSTTGGDQNGRIVENTTVFSTYGSLKGFGDHLHSQGLKLGVYLLPGAVTSDGDKTIENTQIQLKDVFDTSQPGYFARTTFLWGKDGVQQWHDSEIRYLEAQGVDFVKLDFVTPGSISSNPLPTDNSQSVVAYHNSIKNFAPGMRLDISANLDRDSPYWSTWQNNADSLRLNTDVNNADGGGQISSTFVAWQTVQRAIERYRSFINQQTEDSSRQGHGIMIRPDMDNTYIGNPQSLSGISDVQRYSMAIHWIGAGANLITGSDQTTRDSLGYELMYNEEAMTMADFMSQWPMQPRNPSGWGTAGAGASMQLQAWIAGPNEQGTAVAVLANYGPDLGQGGFNTNWTGTHLVSIQLSDLGIGPGMQYGGNSWSVRRVWGGGGSGGGDHQDIGTTSDKIESWLGEGESVLYKLQKQS